MTSVENVVDKRCHNYLACAAEIVRRGKADRLVFPSLPDGCAPFALAVRAPHQRNVLRFLIKRGIPAQSWPSLPQEVDGNPMFPVANSLQREIILLPCHQDLEEHECVDMASALVGALADA